MAVNGSLCARDPFRKYSLSIHKSMFLKADCSENRHC